jgi:hypothetical protein
MARAYGSSAHLLMRETAYGQASFDFRGAKNDVAGRMLTVTLTNDLDGRGDRSATPGTTPYSPAGARTRSGSSGRRWMRRSRGTVVGSPPATSRRPVVIIAAG